MHDVFDDAGLIRIPPFEDSHMHFTLGGKPATPAETRSIIEQCKACGIFSFKEMGNKNGIGLEARKLSGSGVLIRSAGYALYKKGGYGGFLGMAVSTREEIIRSVREISDAGADFVKVVNSGIVSLEGEASVTAGGFSHEELRTIVAEARERNLEVACHANSDKAIRDAVTAGVSSIEHGFFISTDALHLMAESGVSWTPTVFALLSQATNLTASGRGRIEEVIEEHLLSISYASSIGVKLRIGTDSGSKGVIHGESFIEELRLFRKAGLSIGQILNAACMDEGEVERGNFLLVDKDFISAGGVAAIYRAGLLVAS